MRLCFYYTFFYISTLHIGNAFAVEIAPKFVVLGHELSGRELPVFSSQPLKASDKVKKIVIVLHGLKRNAGDYFRMIKKAAPQTSLETLILAPQFLNQKDKRRHSHKLPPNILFWHKSEWKNGQNAYKESADNKTTSSFAVMDELLLRLKSLYPNVQSIVFVSHSAGSQFLQRYAALTQIDSHPDMQSVHMRFLVSDPSSYLYFDQECPAGNGEFKPIDLKACPNGNKYHYGLDKIVPYGVGYDALDLRQKYLARDIRYILGTKDNNPNDPVMDKKCGAMAQGANRLARGLNYVQYLQRFGKTSPIYLIEGADHDAANAGAKIYHSQIGRELVFGSIR